MGIGNFFNRSKRNKDGQQHDASSQTTNEAVDNSAANNNVDESKPTRPSFSTRVRNRFSKLRDSWKERTPLEKAGIIGGVLLGAAALAFTGGVIGVLATGAATSLTGAIATVGSAIGTAATTVGSGIATASTAVGEAIIGTGASTTAATAVGGTILGASAAAVAAGTYVAQDKIRDRLDANRKERKEELKDPLTRAEQRRQSLHKKAEVDYKKAVNRQELKDIKKIKKAETDLQKGKKHLSKVEKLKASRENAETARGL